MCRGVYIINFDSISKVLNEYTTDNSKDLFFDYRFSSLKEFVTESHVYSCIREAFMQVKRNGCRIVALTNKSQEAMDNMIDKLEFREFCDNYLFNIKDDTTVKLLAAQRYGVPLVKVRNINEISAIKKILTMDVFDGAYSYK